MLYEPPGDFANAVPRSLAGKAVLEDYTFPPSPFVPRVLTGVEYPVRLLIHNVGSPGIIAGGVVNSSGNPGTFTYFDGSAIEISPGHYVRSASSADVPNCNRIDINKKIRFNSAGTYAIKLWAMHEEAGNWVYDQEVNLSITVTDDGVPPEEPHTFPIHIFDNVKLKAEWFDIGKSRTNSIIDIDPLLLVSARLDYTVQYTQGTPLGEIAKIAVDGTQLVSENLVKGAAKSGTIDLTGLIGRTVSVTISFESFIGFWSEVLFDVWITLVYSEAPPVDPTTPPFNWSEFINKYGTWIALGFTGLAVLYLMRRPGMPIIVIPGGKR